MIETPHTVTLEIPETAELPEGWAGTIENAGTVSLNVQITPKTPGFAMERYGVELARPHKMMGNIEDEPFFMMHSARVLWDQNGRQREFRIMSAHRAHLNGDDCDHVSVMLEENVYGSA